MSNIINFPVRPNMGDYRQPLRTNGAHEALSRFFAAPPAEYVDILEKELSLANRRLQDERRISDQNFRYAQAAERTMNAYRASWVFRIWEWFNGRAK
jgi:hypothetical protein